MRQHYHDFLNREPDAAGLAFWTNEITSCGADPQCIDIKRVNVSAAFFLSIEFQDTGGTAYLASKASFGTVPNYTRFERDSQALGRDYIFTAPGSAAVLEANKVAYFNDFVNRPEFISIYGSLTSGQYVDSLIANSGVSFTQAERDALVNGLNGNTETRATVLRKISDKPSFRQVLDMHEALLVVPALLTGLPVALLLGMRRGPARLVNAWEHAALSLVITVSYVAVHVLMSLVMERRVANALGLTPILSTAV